MQSTRRWGFLRRLAQTFGPYLIVEILLPGGSLIALLLFLYQQKRLPFGRVARSFRASAARVFAAWLDAGTAGSWLFATASQPIEAVEIDPRVGGAFRLIERRHGHITEHTGRYLELMPSQRIVFTLSREA